MFRFFCDRDMRLPREQALPKSDPLYVCSSCGDRISIEMDDEGPYLHFLSRPEGHFVAKESDPAEPAD